MAQITGVTVTSHADEVRAALERAKAPALEALGTEAEKNAKLEISRKPKHWVDTGRLRASITHAVKGTDTRNYKYKDDNGKPYDYDLKGGAEENSVYIGTNVPYASVIEYGSVYYHDPSHYLQRGIANYADKYKAIIETVMKANS